MSNVGGSSTGLLVLVGDYVHLAIQGLIVGNGVVCDVAPNATCHGIELGNGRIKVQIDSATVQGVGLPFPHAGAELVEECVGSFAIWNVHDVMHVDGENMVEAEMTEDELPHEIPKSPNADETKNVQSSTQWANRSKWYMMDVMLYTLDRKICLGRGPITLPRATDAINNERIGDDHVGVVVVDILCDISSPLFAKEFPLYVKGCPLLVKWPINSLKVVQGGVFLGDILQDNDDTVAASQSNDLDNPEGPLLLQAPKRAYNFVKRRKMDPTLKLQKEMEKKSAKHITPESINAVRSKKCGCLKECCRLMSFEAVRDARQDYYGLSSSDRASHIFDQFRMREESIARSGHMVFDGKVVCKEAFWLLYGFGRSTFFKLQGEYLKGAKVGFHGNIGTKKTWSHTLMARSYLNHFLVTNGEPMPHLPYLGRFGTSNICYKLPACYSREEIFQEVSSKLEITEIPLIAKSTFHSLWRENFANFSIHKRSAFAKCEDCTTLKEKLMKEKRSHEHMLLEQERDRHMLAQMSRRSLYWANRILANRSPDKYLCLTHDKMDQAKTGLPRMTTILKSMQSAGIPLPISLTGMLTHGRQPGVYGHFGLTGLWPGDGDFTVTSIAKCLRDLEKFTGDRSGDIGILPRNDTKPIFQALLDQEVFKVTYLQPNNIQLSMFRGEEPCRPESSSNEEASTSTPTFIPLPDHLTLQLDNSGKDNKNWVVMAFGSHMVIRGIFKTVQISFLMRGHTHEDIDALFSKVSTRIYNREVTTFSALMAEMWQCESIHPVSRLITEVADYKAFVKPFVKTIQGQSRPIAFLFSMRNNVPIYQVKEGINDSWMPPQGRTLWNIDEATNSVTLPMGEPFAKRIADPQHKRAGEIIPYLTQYINWLERTWKDTESEGYHLRQPLVEYWKRIRTLLTGSLEVECMGQEQPCLREGFWPMTDHGTGYKVSSDVRQAPDESQHNETLLHLERELQAELDDRNEIFVGAYSEKERNRFVPLEDIQDGRFIIIRPTSEFEAEKPGCFWVARAIGKVIVDKSSEHCGEFKLHWWRPKHRKANVSDIERYDDCFNPKKMWECDPRYNLNEDQWMNATAAMYFWQSRASTSTKTIRVPETVLDIISETISRIVVEENIGS